MQNSGWRSPDDRSPLTQETIETLSQADPRARVPQAAVEVPVAPIDGRYVELADIKSQYHAKRALEIAAGGGHNLLML